MVGGEVEVDSDGDATLRAPGFPVLDFMCVPDAKTVKNRLHLDLRAADFDAAVEQALAARRAPRSPDAHRIRVRYASFRRTRRNPVAFVTSA